MAATGHAHGGGGQGALHCLLQGHVTGTWGGRAPGAGPVSTLVPSGQLWGGRRLPRSAPGQASAHVPNEWAGPSPGRCTPLPLGTHWNRTLHLKWASCDCAHGGVWSQSSAPGHDDSTVHTPGQDAGPGTLSPALQAMGPHCGNRPGGCLRDPGTRTSPCKPAHHCRSGPA